MESRVFDVEPDGSWLSVSSSWEEPFACCAVCAHLPCCSAALSTYDSTIANDPVGLGT